MTFKPSFQIGESVSNEQLYREFSCGNMGGMRRSKTNNCLILISDHTKSLYDDKWYGDELHYTGMGKLGDQSLTVSQNKTLAESNANDIDVFLFEVMEPQKYTYRGLVKLNDAPYEEMQPDENGDLRKVWMFPLMTVERRPITRNELDKYIETRRRKARDLAFSELRQQAMNHRTKVGSSRLVISNTYVRDEFIAEYTKRSANGICELCETRAPFVDKNGKPYLESHHVVWLSQGGSDSVDNTVALCPNCHKKMHIVADSKDVEKLLAKAKERSNR